MKLFKYCLVTVFFAVTAIAVARPGPDSNYNIATSSGGGGSASYTAIYGDAQNLGFGAGPYTSPSQTWTTGTAIVFIFSETPNTDFAVTIKGVSATQIGGYSGTGHRGSFWRANVTAGSGTVSFTSAAGSLANIATAGGVITTSTATPSSSQVADMLVVSEPQGTVTATVPSSGIAAVFAASLFGSSAAFPCSWTGATRDAITEAQIATGNGVAVCGAHTATTGSVTPTVSTANGLFSNEGTNGAMAIGAWSP